MLKPATGGAFVAIIAANPAPKYAEMRFQIMKKKRGAGYSAFPRSKPSVD